MLHRKNKMNKTNLLFQERISATFEHSSGLEVKQTPPTPAEEVDQKASHKRKLSDNSNNSGKIKRPRKEKKEQVYEVELVVDHKTVKNKHLYLVKWENWSSDSNTWEPSEHLDGCHDALFVFLDKLTSRENYSEKDFLNLKNELSRYENSELTTILKDYVTLKGIVIPPPNFEKTNERLKIVSRWSARERDPNIVKIVRRYILEAKLYKIRQDQLDRLKEWEMEMNFIIGKSKCKPISVVNNVDLEGPPENFSYINDYLPGERVNIPEDPPVGCNCDPICSSFHKCCARITGSTFAYDKDGKLRVPPGTPIYECNKRCKCGKECINRVVQRGRTLKLSIFRTSTGCGWGVKAMESIPKGAFVSEYVGEVITFDEAERRGKKYDREGQTYLFDLDFNDTNAFPFTVDAAVYGNISHFVNHSCDPNMTVYAVYANCLDPNLPKLALFANREIKQGEEISFDYLNQSKGKKGGNAKHNHINKNGPVTKNGVLNKKFKYSKMTCKCGSKKCRKFYLY